MTERHGDSSSWARQWEIFHAALERPATDRAQFLAEACPDDELRREVQDLLESHEGAAGPLDKALDMTTDAPLEDHPSREVTLIWEAMPTLPLGTLLANRFVIVRSIPEWRSKCCARRCCARAPQINASAARFSWRGR